MFSNEAIINNFFPSYAVRNELAHVHTLHEVIDALSMIRGDKVGGSSGILPEVVKVCINELLQYLMQIFGSVLERKVVVAWCIIGSSTKKGKLSLSNNRGYALPNKFWYFNTSWWWTNAAKYTKKNVNQSIAQKIDQSRAITLYQSIPLSAKNSRWAKETCLWYQVMSYSPSRMGLYGIHGSHSLSKILGQILTLLQCNNGPKLRNWTNIVHKTLTTPSPTVSMVSPWYAMTAANPGCEKMYMFVCKNNVARLLLNWIILNEEASFSKFFYDSRYRIWRLTK